MDFGQKLTCDNCFSSFNYVHSGLWLNLNLCLFLQTLNAISESEYVKIGSMCIFFLISVICSSENKTLYISRVKFKSCFISIKQRLLFTNFATIVCSSWLSGRALDKKNPLPGRPLVRMLVETNIFGHFLPFYQHPSAPFYI